MCNRRARAKRRGCRPIRKACPVVRRRNRELLKCAGESIVNPDLIEKLLCLLDVRLHALALCEVERNSRLRIPPMETVLVHYVLEGEGQLQSGDSLPVRFAPDTLLFIPQQEAHDLYEEGSEAARLVLWQDHAVPFSDGLMRLSTGKADGSIVTACGTLSTDCAGVDLFERFREPMVEDLSGSPAVRAAFELLRSELERPLFGTRPLSEALMKQCLVLAIRRQVERGDLRLLTLVGAHDPRLTRALLSILEDPVRDHSLGDLANISGMSRSLFAERFAEAFQRPPMDLLRQVRLHRAAQLLRATSLPVQVIALSVGYASRSYFSRAFRAAYGEDPKSFRQRARSGTEQTTRARPAQE